MRLLTNPLFLRSTALLLVGIFAFILGALLMKRVKRGIQRESTLGEGTSSDNLPLHTYHAVIQQLKQQKHELQALQQEERRRSKTTENLSATVLSSLSSGVLFFNSAGLVRQANAAARSILGFAAPIGMNVEDLFRDAAVVSKHASEIVTAAGAVRHTLLNAVPFGRLETDYVTPAGEPKVLELTVSAVYGSDAKLLGVSCVIEDQTEIVKMRKKQELRGELSAEMALELRSSLQSISQYAQVLAVGHDDERRVQVINDIAAEIRHLEKRIGGFLGAAHPAEAESAMCRK